MTAVSITHISAESTYQIEYLIVETNPTVFPAPLKLEVVVHRFHNALFADAAFGRHTDPSYRFAHIPLESTTSLNPTSVLRHALAALQFDLGESDLRYISTSIVNSTVRVNLRQ